jgi:hypothetical protein
MFMIDFNVAAGAATAAAALVAWFCALVIFALSLQGAVLTVCGVLQPGAAWFVAWFVAWFAGWALARC